VALRAAFFAMVVGGSLLWISRRLGLSPWGALPLVITPYYWIYCRQLWDNTFLLPICALTLAAYLEFATRRTTAARGFLRKRGRVGMKRNEQIHRSPQFTGSGADRFASAICAA